MAKREARNSNQTESSSAENKKIEEISPQQSNQDNAERSTFGTSSRSSPWEDESERFRKEFEANARLINFKIYLVIAGVVISVYILFRIIVFLTELYPTKASYLLEKIFIFWKW